MDQSVAGHYPKTIFETLSSLDYKERHFKMDRMFPVVLYKENVPVEFITYPTVDIKAIEKMIGQQIQINKIDKFDFLLKHRISIKVQGKQKDKNYLINCPKPSAFLYHQENGSDEYIHDVRQDIFDRFNGLKEALKRNDK